MIDGRQIAAARALAGLTVRDLAAKAGTTKRVISKIENGGAVLISEKRRHGHVSADLWERIIAALSQGGVELLAVTGTHGPGVRWRTAPR